MRTYETKTAPLVAHYRAKGNFHSVDGNGTVQQTFEPIRDVLDQRLPRAAKERVR
jgi:adenylate kinase family enzyme